MIKYSMIALFVLAGMAASGDVEIGSDIFPANDPFCADCAESMRYQTLYLEEEIGTAIEIQSISLMRTIQGETEVTLDTLVIYMGYSDLDQLGTVFDDNYRPGTMTEVFWEENFTVYAPDPDSWFSIDLELPFFYNGSGNLIIEYSWPDGYGAVYNYHWDVPVRSLTAGWGSSTGFTSDDCPHLLLTGSLSLEPLTFGAIKAMGTHTPR